MEVEDPDEDPVYYLWYNRLRSRWQLSDCDCLSDDYYGYHFRDDFCHIYIESSGKNNMRLIYISTKLLKVMKCYRIRFDKIIWQLERIE